MHVFSQTEDDIQDGGGGGAVMDVVLATVVVGAVGATVVVGVIGHVGLILGMEHPHAFCGPAEQDPLPRFTD